jgi:hypothetical protein
MSSGRTERSWLLAGLICLLLGAMAGCDMPWDDDEKDCPYKDKQDAQQTAPLIEVTAAVQI